MMVGVTERAAIMRAQDEETHHFGIVLGEYLAHGKKIAERFRHLLIVDTHKAVVHPVIDESIAVRALGLRNFVLVVRKLQVLTAAVDIEMVAEQGARHRRALNVPARPALAPWTRPRRLARLGVLPQHEVERIALGLSNLDALAGAQVFQRFARKPAVAGKIADRVI